MAQPAPIRMTASAFARLPESNLPTELLYGEIVVTPASKDPHQDVVLSAAIFLKGLAKQSPGSGLVKVAPLDVYLDKYTVVQPDVFWVSGTRSRCKLGDDGYWHGAPDLIIEVLSPATTQRDKIDKFRLYQEHGVREYWIADPAARYVEVWLLEGSTYQHRGTFGPDESFASTVLGGQTVETKELFVIG
jgi:Uma2 family endonuclease